MRESLALVPSGPFSLKKGEGRHSIFRCTGSFLVRGSSASPKPRLLLVFNIMADDIDIDNTFLSKLL